MPSTPTAAPLNHRYRYQTGGCPVEAALDVIGGRWKGLLIYWIGTRPQRFHELRKELPHISQRMLIRQLRELERDGLIHRSVTLGVPVKVEYSPTAATRALLPLLISLRDWSAQYLLGMTEELVTARSPATKISKPRRTRPSAA